MTPKSIVYKHPLFERGNVREVWKAIMKHYQERWSQLPDARKRNNNKRYEIAANGTLSAFAVFFMQSGSFLAHQRISKSKNGKNNARSLFQVKKIPGDLQIRNLLDSLNSAEFQADFWYIPDKLKGEKQIQQYQNELGTYAIALDGVVFFSSEKISCNQCLKRKDRNGNGTEHDYHSAITPVFVKPGEARVWSLPPEFIIPQDG